MINPGTMASPAPIAVQRATILQVVPRLDSGGAEQSTLEIVEAIVRAGGRALVATAGGRMVDAVVGAGGEVVQMPVATKNPALMLLNVQRLVALIRRERIALIHARSRAPAWCALLAARRTGVAFVTTVHGLHAERGPLKRAYNGVMARGDCVIANSEFTAAGVRARYGVTESRLRVIPRGFDPARFSPQVVTDERVAQVRGRWGVAAGQAVVLLAGRFSAIKGQICLVEATGLLARSGQLGGAAVVLTGDDDGRGGGRMTQRLRTRIGELGLADVVRMPGYEADMPAAYLAAAVTAIPSTRPETFGRVAMEAAAMGCPVIASNIGALPEVLGLAGDDDTMLARSSPASNRQATGVHRLVPPGDVAALAEELGSALAMPPALLRTRARAMIPLLLPVRALPTVTIFPSGWIATP